MLKIDGEKFCGELKAEKGNGIRGELLQFVRLVLTKKWHLRKDQKSACVLPMGIWGESVLGRGNMQDKGPEPDSE